MALRISVFSSPTLDAAVQALRGFDRELQAQIRKATKSVTAPEWQKAVAEHADTKLEQAVLVATARVQVSNQNITLRSAGIGRSLAGGAKPSQLASAAAFGADRDEKTTYTARSKKGKSFTVTRHTRRQLRPHKRTGYAVYPAAAQIIPRIASLWVQTVVRTMHEAFEGK